MYVTTSVLVAYALGFIVALMAAGFVGFLLWSERKDPSTIALGAGSAAAAVLTLTVMVVDQATL